MLSVVPTRRVRPARRTGVLALLVLVLVLGASPAAAHNTLRSTDPADGSTVPTAPAQLTLTFDQAALEIGTQVVVTGPDGVVVSDGPVQLVDVSVVQPLAATLPAGTYTVDWRVTSADGHPLTGNLTFTAAEASGVAEPEPADEPSAAPEPTETLEVTVDASPDVTTQAGPTDDAVTAPADPTDEDGVSPWAWVAVAGSALVALVGAFTVALVTHRRRAQEAAGAAGSTGPEGAGSHAGPTAGA